MNIGNLVVDLARRRLAELQQEQEALVAFLQRSTKTERREVVRATASDTPPRRRQKTKTAAERRAISARMKKYWAERRKG